MKIIEVEDNQSNKFIENLKKDCSEFILQNPTGIPLYRGMNTNRMGNTEYGKLKFDLSNRTPLTTSPEVHNKFNDWFLENYGRKWRNAIFVSGKKNIAQTYGRLYVIIPENNFDFLWNPEIKDLFVTVSKFKIHYDALDTLKMANEHMPYQNTDILSAIKSGNEIMLWSTSCYYIEANLYEDISQLIFGK